jgi:hypothetical protein
MELTVLGNTIPLFTHPFVGSTASIVMWTDSGIPNMAILGPFQVAERKHHVVRPVVK